jgi:hypothetical protein
MITKLSFILKNDDLIYRSHEIALEHVYKLKKLCISSIVIKNILKIAHDAEHSDFVECYDIISFFWYIHELTKYLRQYLQHCSDCQMFQIRRHKFYDSLQSVLISDVFFHTIIIDFILTFFEFNSEKFDIVMSVTCKFSKRITLIFEYFNWKTKNWTLALLTRLNFVDWELLKAIIFDRDSKFLIEFWRSIFDHLRIKLLYSTTYHSQIDE